MIRRRGIAVHHVFEKLPLPVEKRVVFIELVVRTTARVRVH
jgi:hypothetical protein